jgi:ketosteroid isomerase-like protein
MDAYNKKDAATIAKMYTDDAVVSFDQWTASGRAALQDAFDKEFPADTKFTAITVDQSQRIGDLMYARGTWGADAKGPDGKTMAVNGHWLTVGRCQGQTCLIAIHNGNTAMPPPK